MTKKKGREPKPKAKRTHFSLALPPDEIEGLRKIMGWMLTDPDPKPSDRPCWQTTVRYAIQHTLAHPPAHVQAVGT